MPPIVLVTALVAGIYALACWALPFGRCTACKGTGTRKTIITRRYQPCRFCWGAGLRLRLGRRIFNYLATVAREGGRAPR